MSGRTSWAASTLDGRKIGTNLQNFPRVPGVRECIRAREGYALCSVDYDALELRTLAQVVLSIVGRSRLAERFQANPDFDPHSSFAARMLGISYEEAIALKEAKDKGFKAARQKAKAATFGFPGGLGIEKFRDYARKGYGTILSDSEARELKAIWLAEHPEMQSYFRFVSRAAEMGGEIRLPITGRYRGRCGYTDGANYGFQGLASDGAKEALSDVTEACETEGSILYGSHPVVFIHDEIIVEVPLGQADACAKEIKRLMEEAMVRVATPDIPSRASPALSLSWIKEASDVYDAEGFLIPWEWRES
jgi:DNA polymerase I-like protein with 3'-5' exonuclease and polymerase domains